MADRLDIVPVGIEREGAVIVRMIMRADAGRTVVPAAGRECGLVECIDRRAVLGDDGDVNGPVQAAFAADPEIRLAAGPEARGGKAFLGFLRDFHDQNVSERRQRFGVKCPGASVIGDWESDVIDHAAPLTGTTGVERIAKRTLKHNRHKRLLDCDTHLTKRPAMRRPARLYDHCVFHLRRRFCGGRADDLSDRPAQILAGSRFDFKVEFSDRVARSEIRVTVNGAEHAAVFGKAAAYIEKEDGKEQSALILRDVSLTKPGAYAVAASDGTNTREICWKVYATGPAPGQERDPVHRRRHVARASRGGAAAVEGHARRQGARQARDGRHAADGDGRDRRHRFDHHRFRQFGERLRDRPQDGDQRHGRLRRPHRDPFDDPRVETISSLVKRRLGMAVGVVTNTEIEDATPAAMIAHTRRRADVRPDRRAVLRLPSPTCCWAAARRTSCRKARPARKRKDDSDYRRQIPRRRLYLRHDRGRDERRAVDGGTNKLLGLFHTGNMDGALDRKFLKGGTVKRFPDQPDLTEQVQRRARRAVAQRRRASS